MRVVGTVTRSAPLLPQQSASPVVVVPQVCRAPAEIWAQSLPAGSPDTRLEISRPQQWAWPLVLVTPQVWKLPADRWVQVLPAGTDDIPRSSLPQHSPSPLVVVPQVWSSPAEICAHFFPAGTLSLFR